MCLLTSALCRAALRCRQQAAATLQRQLDALNTTSSSLQCQVAAVEQALQKETHACQTLQDKVAANGSDLDHATKKLQEVTAQAALRTDEVAKQAARYYSECRDVVPKLIIHACARAGWRKSRHRSLMPSQP